MFENLIRNIKNRFNSSSTNSEYSKQKNYVYNTTTTISSPAKSKIFDLKFNYYLPIVQNSNDDDDDDDNYCTFMLPRVFEQKVCLSNSNGKNSPVALSFKDERVCEDLENIVDKFVYVIDLKRVVYDSKDEENMRFERVYQIKVR